MLSTKKNFSDLPWRLLLVEAVLVVSSVFLALAMEDWQQDRAEDKLAKRALQEFIDEVQVNCQKIIAVKAYHDSLVGGEREPQGIQIGLLRNDAWDVVKTTGAAPHLNYDVLARMAEISAHQGDHRAVVQAYTQALFSLALQFEQPEDWHKVGERGVVSELVRIQTDLLKQYQKLLGLVKNKYAGVIEIQGACPSR